MTRYSFIGSRVLCLCAASVLAAAQGHAAQPFDCGPFLLQPGPTTMTIVIDHAEPVSARLTWRRADGGGKHTDSRDAARHHIFTLSDLSPDTHYRYRIVADDLDSDERTFHTLPTAPQAYRFLVLGDVRTNPDIWHRVSQRIQENEPEALFIVGTGDYPADGRQYAQWMAQFFDPARDMLARLPFWPAIGNHERTRQYVSAPPSDEVIAEEESHYFSLFDLPGNERWYRVNYQYMTLLVLDSNSKMEPGHEQYEWVREQLRSPRKRFTLAAFHHDPVTSGPHGRRGADGTFNEWPLDQARRFLMPLFEMYGVDLVLNGHDHIYERSQVSGVYYVVTGGGGAPLYGINSSENPFQQVAHAAHHYTAIDVTPASLTLTAIGIDGDILDWFVIPVPTSTATRMTRQWQADLLRTLTFEAAEGSPRVSVRNILGFPVVVEVGTGSGTQRSDLAPGEQGQLALTVDVPDSLLAPPSWRGRVARTVRITMRGESSSIPLNASVEQEVVVREASFRAARMPAPTVDGGLEDWPAGRQMWLDEGTRTIVGSSHYGGAGDMNARLRVGWSEAGLHLALAVDDDEPMDVPGSSPWNVDGVEFFIDSRAEGSRVAGYTEGVNQNVLAAMRPGSASEGNNAWTQPGDFAWQVRTRQGGYDMEIRIPAERIRPAWTPTVGDSLRFDAYVNDRDSDGQSTHRLWSTGSASSSTSGYGVIVLGE